MIKQNIRANCDIAKDLLGNNTRNRAIKKKNVNLFIRDMMTGRWHVDADQPYKFGRNSLLLDGQNRLTALSMCPPDVWINLEIWWECQDESQAFMDRGSKRNLADDFKINGFKGHTTLAAAIPPICYYLQHGRINDSNPQPHFDEAERLIAIYPSILEWANECVRLVQLGQRQDKTWEPARAASLGFLFELATDYDTSHKFIESVVIGINIPTTDDARYRLRSLLVSDRQDRKRLPSNIIFQYSILAWNKFVTNTPVKHLKLANDFPLISKGTGQGWLKPSPKILSVSSLV